MAALRFQAPDMMTNLHSHWLPVDGDDYAPALVRALAESLETGIPIFVPNGEHWIKSTVHDQRVTGDVRIVGESRRAVLSGTQILNLVSYGAVAVLAEPVKHGDTEITLADATMFSAGCILYMHSPENAEPWWNTRRIDTREVVSVDGNTLTLSSPLLFHHVDPSSVTVAAYPPNRFSLENLTIKSQLPKNVNKTKFHVVGFVPTIRDVNFIDDRLLTSGINFARCIGGRISNCKFSHIFYGILINESSDFVVRDIDSDNCRHPIVPGAWSNDIIVERLRGSYNHSTIDSHPATNVTYRDVRAFDHQISNCRALGVTLKDVHLRVTTEEKETTYAYFGFPSNSANYAEYPYFKKYGITLKNVDWIVPEEVSTTFNCIAILAGQRVVRVDNCRMTAVAADNISVAEGISISNSTVGMVWNYNWSSLQIDNTIFDWSISPRNAELMVRQSLNETLISNCNVKGEHAGRSLLFGSLGLEARVSISNSRIEAHSMALHPPSNNQNEVRICNTMLLLENEDDLVKYSIVNG